MISTASQKRTAQVIMKFTVLAVLLGAAIISGRFARFMHGSGLTLVLAGGIALAFMGFSWGDIRAAFAALTRSSDSESLPLRSAHFWESCARNFWMLGILGAAVSFVIALSSHQGGLGGIASRMAEAFISTVYGMILAIVCLVPAWKLSCGPLRPEDREPTASSPPAGRRQYVPLKLENILGYVIFFSVLGGIIISSSKTWEAGSPINPIEVFLHWPALLVVLGGAIVFVLFSCDPATGRAFTLSFALTGLLGTLMGFVQVLLSLGSRNIREMTMAVTFIISTCIYALLGMMLVGKPWEDRSLGNGDAGRRRSLVRMAMYVFPLVVLIFLAFAFVLVITPIQKVE